MKTYLLLVWYGERLIMLMDFYLFALSFVIFIGCFAIILKKKNLIHRCLTLFFLINLFFFSLWNGVLGFTILISCLALLGIYEISDLYKGKWWFPVSIASILVVFLVHFSQSVMWFLPIFFVIIFWSFSPLPIKNYWYLSLFCMTFLVGATVLLVETSKFDILFIPLLILLLQLNDVFGYLFGKLWGKTKIFPELSPNKTLEGYLAGIVGVIFGLIILHTIIPMLRGKGLFVDASLFFLIIFTGNIGDLMFSAIKRKLDVKDFSNLLPGHGGVLDRMDNVLFSAPFFYFFTKWILI